MARRICLRDVGVLSRCSRWIMFERSKQIKVARGVDKAGGVYAMKFGREKGDDRIFANIASPELYKRLFNWKSLLSARSFGHSRCNCISLKNISGSNEIRESYRRCVRFLVSILP